MGCPEYRNIGVNRAQSPHVSLDIKDILMENLMGTCNKITNDLLRKFGEYDCRDTSSMGQTTCSSCMSVDHLDTLEDDDTESDSECPLNCVSYKFKCQHCGCPIAAVIPIRCLGMPREWQGQVEKLMSRVNELHQCKTRPMAISVPERYYATLV